MEILTFFTMAQNGPFAFSLLLMGGIFALQIVSTVMGLGLDDAIDNAIGFDADTDIDFDIDVDVDVDVDIDVDIGSHTSLCIPGCLPPMIYGSLRSPAAYPPPACAR